MPHSIPTELANATARETAWDKYDAALGTPFSLNCGRSSIGSKNAPRPYTTNGRSKAEHPTSKFYHSQPIRATKPALMRN